MHIFSISALEILVLVQPLAVNMKIILRRQIFNLSILYYDPWQML